MADKNKSVFKVMLKTVTTLPWLKVLGEPDHINMNPGKYFNKPISNHAFDYMKELNDEEFEKLVALIFKQRGYTLSEKNSQKDSVNIVLHMDNEATFVQYKHWREHHVDSDGIEELYNAMEEESAPHGIVITSGTFTTEALDYALGKTLMLINGVDLSLMIEVLNASSPEDDDTSETQTVEANIEIEDEMPELEPLCPICSQKMILRTAKKGKNAGNTFWGCSQFPNCLGVVSNN